MEKNPNPLKDQHFMVDKDMLEKIYDVSNIIEGESIVEVGGGAGALTDYLVQGNNSITVIEKDSYYANLLKQKYNDIPNVNVIDGDALNFDFSGYDRIIANLPYTITEPFLMNLAMSGVLAGEKDGSNLKKMTLVLSQNSVRKMTAPIQITEGTSKHFNQEFGIISAICKSFLDIKIETPIPSEAFFPEPAVTSFLVTFTPKKQLTTVDRIMKEFLCDKKLSMPHIGRIYHMMLNQGKIYKLSKHKNNVNVLLNASFTSKNILNKNIYELSNSQISQLVQDLIRNDINNKSKSSSNRRREEFDIQDYFTKGKFSYEQAIEDYELIEEENRPIIKSEEKIKIKYNYFYDDFYYNLLLCRGWENYSEEDFQKKLVR
ncbi:MAG: hypothetical protein IJY25_02070 [Bacilli bacterium]|nr:hypothetical protein [Bacilli bacterium]